MSIVVENATKRFGEFVALDEVSIEVPDGSLTALLGPSGSGKSTLLRVIAGLETPDSGSVLISGQDMTEVPVQDRHVGFCFQHYAAFKHGWRWLGPWRWSRRCCCSTSRSGRSMPRCARSFERGCDASTTRCM